MDQALFLAIFRNSFPTLRIGAPVINLGESLLLFVGALEDRPVAVDGHVAIRPILTSVSPMTTV